jgi:hypothetical protein
MAGAALLDRLPDCDVVNADKAYDTNALRDKIRDRGALARAHSATSDSGRDSFLVWSVRVLARNCDGDAPCLGPTVRICVIAL